MVLDTKMLGDILGQWEVLAFFHADGEALDIRFYLMSHIGYQAAVQTAAQEDTTHGVVPQALLDGFRK